MEFTNNSGGQKAKEKLNIIIDTRKTTLVIFLLAMWQRASHELAIS
jgi:hypothetical protein